MSEERNPTTENNGTENNGANGAPAEETTPVANLSAEADTPSTPAGEEVSIDAAAEGSAEETPSIDAASDTPVVAEAESTEVAEEEVAPAAAVSAEATSSPTADAPAVGTAPAAAPAPVAQPPAQAAGPVPTQTAGPKEYTPEYEVGGRSRRIHIEVRLDEVNYKNVALLGRFLDPRGRILSRRKTRVSAKAQRRVVNAIKLARHVALLPYTAEQTRIVRRRR